MTNKKYLDNSGMNLSLFVKWCRQSPQRHIKLIGEYADERKINFNTKGQWTFFMDRNMRPAIQLSIFSDEQIANAIEEIRKAEKEYLSKWTMETLIKFLLK
jgi:hypothetical protein